MTGLGTIYRLRDSNLWSCRSLSVLWMLVYQATACAAPLGDQQLCQSAIDGIKTRASIPAGLLTAIGIVESGRAAPGLSVVAPWPWSVDIEGSGRAFSSREEAIAAVTAARARGATSIDVGCMQVNLKYHPDAFPNLESAFEPATNVRYASTLLEGLYKQSGNWTAAIQAYHSARPEFGIPYGERVAAVWRGKDLYSSQVPPQGAGSAQRLAQDQLVDRYHVFEPEFRKTMIEAALFRSRRDVNLGLVSAEPSMLRRRQNALEAPGLKVAYRVDYPRKQ